MRATCDREKAKVLIFLVSQSSPPKKIISELKGDENCLDGRERAWAPGAEEWQLLLEPPGVTGHC